MQPDSVKLPTFVIDRELTRVFRSKFPDYLGTASSRENFVFDWSDVCFFDDFALLKLLFLQRRLRSQGLRLRNRGFDLGQLYPNMPTVVRQLWAVGLPELMASGHLFLPGQLADVLKDEAALLESNPLGGAGSPATATAIVPMLCCHDRAHFTPGSREEKQVDAFLRTCLRPAGEKHLAWDLVENRNFRHLMLQQLRRNVWEHSRPDGRSSVGLAIARVWTGLSLSDEWSLTEDQQHELLRLWGDHPVARALALRGQEDGILQISVVDDGPGIPHNLEEIHTRLVSASGHPGEQQDLFAGEARLHYRDREFDGRFAEPACWTDPKARLIAFATDRLGTSKADRAPEVKGLEYLRCEATVSRGGVLIIESDGKSVGGFTRAHEYGEPRRIDFDWSTSEGTGICLAVPMKPVEAHSEARGPTLPGVDLDALASTGSGVDRFDVREHLRPSIPEKESSESTDVDVNACVDALLIKIRLRAGEDDVAALRRNGLLVVDWGELPDSKRVFHHLLTAVAQRLATIESREMRPFIFANLPMGLCGLLDKALGSFSAVENPTPVCAFASEQREAFWLGLDGDNSLGPELRPKVSSPIARKLTDHRENRTEAFYRDCLSRMLASTKEVKPSYDTVLEGVAKDCRDAVKRSVAFSRLCLLAGRCPLLREQEKKVFGDPTASGAFVPVFRGSEIVAAVRELFLAEFRDVLTSRPVCFTPPDPRDGIELPHGKRKVARYFRADALVDTPIATELAHELAAIANDIAAHLPGSRIDWVVSCTTPLHWFVHRIVDGLSDRGVKCSHYVFPSYEAIPSTVEDIHMRPGDTVLAFTDVIASGMTVARMAHSLVDRFGVRMVGLLALADTRTALDRAKGPELEETYETIVCLYNKPEEVRPELRRAYYVHPDTVVPKKVSSQEDSPADHFFDANFAGVGPLIENHAYFYSASPTLNLLKSLDAVRLGHFQHGSHHSEVLVDVEKMLGCREYRNLMVTALFRYICEHKIRLVLYPSHSSAYILADELKERFAPEPSLVQFIMACRTYRGTRGTSYSLTRFSPHSESEWQKYSSSSVLILDDAVCTGSTIESIIAELARVDRNYYDIREPAGPRPETSKLAVHVVAFLNRLPRVSGDFWRGLSQITARRVEFSAFVTMPLASESAESCHQCRLVRRLQYVTEATKYGHYANEFLRWWQNRAAVVDVDERGQSDVSGSESRFSAEDVLRIAGYLCAIDRRGYSPEWVRPRLFAASGATGVCDSVPVRVHVRSRAAFLDGLLPEQSSDSVDDLCKELEALIRLTFDANGKLIWDAEALEILQVMTVRYLRTRPRQQEAIAVVRCLLLGFASALDSRLVVGGVVCVLDTCLERFRSRQRTEWMAIRHAIRASIPDVRAAISPSSPARWVIDWLDVYLADDGEGISSVGKAVQILARYAQKGRKYHIYGRYELDELLERINRPPAAAAGDAAQETVRRVLGSCDQFSEMLIATRALRSRSALLPSDLEDLQKRTAEHVEAMRRSCAEFRSSQAKLVAKEDAYRDIREHFNKAYLLWFPSDAKAKAAAVISHFLPSVATCVKDAAHEFLKREDRGQGIVADYTGLSAHADLKVVVDPEVLQIATGQVLHNFARLKQSGTPARVHWSIREAGTDPDGGSNRMVELQASNTGTPHADLPNLTLRGLGTVRGRLEEYGGELAILEPQPPWTFQVAVRLQRWTEVHE